MTFSDAIKSGFNRYTDFSGRSSRSEFWWFSLFAGVLNAIVDYTNDPGGPILFSLLTAVISLALIVPSLAVGARRLHDTGRSGWWQLLNLTLIGALVVIYWWIQPGESGANRYGPPASA